MRNPPRLFRDRRSPRRSPPAVTRAAAPSAAELTDAAAGHFRGGRYVEALDLCRAAIRLDPSLAQAHTNAGAAAVGLGRHDEGIAHLRAAIGLAPGMMEAHHNLGRAMADLGRYDEAAAGFKEAIRLKPDSQNSWLALGAALANAVRYPEALEALERAVEIDPADREGPIWRGVVRFGLGDYAGAWPDLEARRPTPAAGELPRWDGRALAGTLVIDGLAEGFGDCIQGIRFAAAARERVGSVVMVVYPELARLLARTPGVDRIVTDRADVPPAAAMIEPLALGRFFCLSREAMWGDGRPYLTADPAAFEDARRLFAGVSGLKIGIAWQGNRANCLDHRRSFPLAAMAPLAAVPGVTFVSLQKGEGLEQLRDAPFPVTDLGPVYRAGDWLDTAAVVSQLDLVISPDSAICHLAGALGKTAWIAMPKPAEWRWGPRGERTGWYATARLFRQSSPGAWPGVFERMAAELGRMAAR